MPSGPASCAAYRRRSRAGALGRSTAASRAGVAGRPTTSIRPRLLAQREVLDPNARLFSPLTVRVLRNKVAVGIDRVGASRVLPVAVFTKLGDTGPRLGGQFAFWVLLDELAVSLDGVGRLRGTPILLLAAAAGHQQQ